QLQQTPIQMLQEKFRRYQELRQVPQAFDQSSLDAAMAERDKRQGLALALKGAQQIGQGIANRYAPNYKADTSVADKLVDLADQPVQDAVLKNKMGNMQNKENDAMLEASMKLESLNLDLTNMDLNNDASSPISKLAQETALKFNPKLNPEAVAQTPASQLFKMFPQFQQLAANEIRRQQTGQNMLSLQLRKESNEIARANMGLRRELHDDRMGHKKDEFQWKKGEKDELSDKQTESIAAVDSVLLDLNDAMNFKVDVNTGRIESSSDYIKKLLGKQDPNMVNLKMALGNALADRKREITGTAASDQEAKFIESITVPDPSMDDALFMSTLQNAIRRVERYRELKLDSYKKQGKNPEAFKEQFDPNAKKVETAPANEVVRRDPKSGKNAVFNSETKEFIRWEK
ncbi:MAG: hypothetical protein ACRDBG_26475, partial [Waterburya sp.]